jgi:hypothetical protein
VKSSALGSMKFARLQAILGTPHRGDVAGILEMLWQFAGSNAITGAIGKFSDEDIAAWMGCRMFDRSPREFMDILVQCGFVDRHPVHRLVVHDWHDHCAQYVKGNLARYGGKFANLPDDDPRQPNPASARAHSKAASRDTALAPAKAASLERATKPSQAKPSLPPPTPAMPNASPPSLGGGGRMAIHPDWAAVLADLKTLGVTTAEPTVAAAIARAVAPEWARGLIEHYRTKPGAWNPQFLAWRLKEGDPSIAANEGWPQPAESYVNAKAQQAKALEQHTRAEDSAVYTAIKEGRASGKPDELIRDELVAKGLVKALIRFGWLEPNGKVPMPATPPEPAKASPAAAPPAAGPPAADSGDNPF